MNEAIAIIILFGIVSLFVWILFAVKPTNTGSYGELKISSKLKRLSSRNYRVLNDVLIRKHSRSSQIDHIVISNYGVFVIETKNYNGWIFGNERSDEWTQTFKKSKFKFRNPVLQCWGHINALKSVLSDFSHISYFPVVVFTEKAKLKNITTDVPVINSNNLLRYISECSTSDYISDEEVDQIYQELVRLNTSNRTSRKTHVRKAKEYKRKGGVSKTCPKCGARLVLRHGTFGMFYGCATFPRCDFTKNYKK